MRKLLYFVIFVTFSGAAQTTPGDFLNADNRIPDIPQTPEVAAFEKYGSLPVNLYSGTPNIAIPIYTFQGHEMDFPISLTYDASGIKVDQIATGVGLGWNLKFGGVVSRNVQGHADINIVSGSYYNIVDNVTRDALNVVYTVGFGRIFGTGNGGTRLNIYENYQTGLIDLQADTFSFNVNGLSGTFIIDYDEPVGNSSYKVYCIENPNIKGEFTDLNSWKITNTDGASYFFNKAERTRHEYSVNGLEYQEVYESAWYLTKVVSPNGVDVYDLSYSPSNYWVNNNDRKFRHATVMSYYNPGACGTGQVLSVPEIPAFNFYKKEQFNLTGISHNQINVLSAELNNETSFPRKDLDGMRYYDKLTIKNEFSDPLLIVDFDNHNYFQKLIGQSNDETNSRLKLNGVSFYRDSGSTDKKTYTFDYYDVLNFPSRSNNGVDFWGYYTGSGVDGGSLIPETFDFPFTAPNGINRSSVFFHTKKGTIKSITYPTGGMTTFTYEAHKVPTGPGAPNGVVGGLRIAKQETTTQDVSGNSNAEVKYYYYGDIVADVNNNPNLITIALASGDEEADAIVQQDLMFTQIKTVWDATDPCGDIHPEKYYQHANNRTVKVPNAITYSTVSEVIFKGTKFIGCTVSKFYNDQYTDQAGVPVRPFYNEKLLNGELNESLVYDSSLNLKQSSISTYANIDLDVPTGFSQYNGIYLYAPDIPDPTGDPYVFEPACKDAGGNDFKYYPATTLQCLANGNQAAGSAINYIVNRYSYKQYHKRLLSSTNRTYEGATTIEDITNYTYQALPNANHFFPVEVKVTDSKGKESKTEILYAADLAGTSVMNTLIGRNQIAEPIEVKKYYDNNLMSVQKRNFTVTGVSNLGQSYERDIIRPSSVEVSKSSDALEVRRVYHAYDEFGNLTEVSNNDGSHTYYIWGYNGRHLLAEIRNKPTSSIPPGIQNLISSVQTISNSENSALEEDSLRSGLENIRSQAYFDESPMTSFTYDPGIGLTSSTDPRGYTMFYTYDEHNRLEWVKDADGKVLGNNEYSYRINN